jgi:protocatechuate 3,4-dioxygenase beta subunit
VWSRPGLDRRTRHLVTIGMLAALDKWDELAMHVGATTRTGVTLEELIEVFLQVAVYAGVPSANSAVTTAKRVLEAIAAERSNAQSQGAGEVRHSANDERTSRRDWGVQPPYLWEPYKSTVLRSPRKPLVPLAASLSEFTTPVFGHDRVEPEDADLTRTAGTDDEPIGQRIHVCGRVLDEDGRPVANALVEVWQANAAGRYRHQADQCTAPLDPHFTGAGRCLTNAEGEYRFTTIHPGAYPWRNHPNAWRPSHIHFSLFGSAFISRLVTQMYFPGDPLHALDPILNSVPADARHLLVAEYAHVLTEEGYALGYRWDIVLRGRHETPMEHR